MRHYFPAVIAVCSFAFACSNAKQQISAGSSDTSQSSGVASSATQFGDSTTFDPDGYYVPMARNNENTDKLEHLELRTLEYSYDGAVHYDRPKLLAPKALLVFRSTDSSAITSQCEGVSVSRDSLVVDCGNTPIGSVALRIRLLDARGHYWRLSDYDEQVREIANGELLAKRRDGRLLVRPVAFYYTGGH